MWPERRQYVFPPFRIDPANQQLWRGNDEIRLRGKTFAVLRFLVDHPGQLVTKDGLLDAVWAGVAVGDSMPAICVAELRKALRDQARTPQFIETVQGRGYRFIAKVTIANPATTIREPSLAPAPIIVGRDDELARMHRWFAKASEGTRQVVFVSGEAGIGKTIYVRMFLDSLHQDGAVRIGRGQCIEQYGSGEPYMPVLEALTRLCQEPGGERLLEILRRVAPTWLAQMPSLVPPEDRARLHSETQGATRQRMLREMAEALEAMAADASMVLILEDLHWSDPSTLELISAISRRTDRARLLIIGAYRQVEMLARDNPLRPLKEELELHQQCVEMRLKLLSEADVADYLRLRFTDGEVGPSLIGLAPAIHRRTEGNPLFMVNVVDYLVAQGRVFDASKIATPRSIRQMIERNLERLGSDEQLVLESASVAGAEFSAAAVAAALERPLSEIEACCARLSRHELFVQALGPTSWPDGTVATGVRFLHALYRDALYDRVPPGHRVELHRRIAEREEAAYGAKVSEIATELAYHYGRANVAGKAVQYLALAGRQALKRSAFAEAQAHLQKGLDLLKTLPASAERDTRELDLMSALVRVISITQGYSAPEARAAAAHADPLAEKVGNLQQLVLRRWANFLGPFAAGDHVAAGALADQILDLAQRDSSPRSLVFAHQSQLFVRFFRGDLVGSEEHFARMNGFAETVGFKQISNELVVAFFCAALGAWALGHFDTARERATATVTFAQDNQSPYLLAIARSVESQLYRWLREHQLAASGAVATLALSEEHGFSYYRDLACIHLGWARAYLGSAKEGVPLIRKGLAGFAEAGVKLQITDYLMRLAEAQVLDGLIDDAFATIEEALQANPAELVFQPHILTYRGELRLQQGHADPAESDFRNAIALARKMSAKAFELRATTSLARLLSKQGRRDEARAMLTEICTWFTEGFDTLDLMDAKALLDELNPARAERRSGRKNRPVL